MKKYGRNMQVKGIYIFNYFIQTIIGGFLDFKSARLKNNIAEAFHKKIPIKCARVDRQEYKQDRQVNLKQILFFFAFSH